MAAAQREEPAAFQLVLEAHQPANQRVVLRVGVAGMPASDGAVERKLRVMWQPPGVRHLDPQRPQPGRSDRNEQRFDAPFASAERSETGLHELSAGDAVT